MADKRSLLPRDDYEIVLLSCADNAFLLRPLIKMRRAYGLSPSASVISLSVTFRRSVVATRNKTHVGALCIAFVMPGLLVPQSASALAIGR